MVIPPSLGVETKSIKRWLMGGDLYKQLYDVSNETANHHNRQIGGEKERIRNEREHGLVM